MVPFRHIAPSDPASAVGGRLIIISKSLEAEEPQRVPLTVMGCAVKVSVTGPTSAGSEIYCAISEVGLTSVPLPLVTVQSTEEAFIVIPLKFAVAP